MHVAPGAFHHFREDASGTCCCGGAAKAHKGIRGEHVAFNLCASIPDHLCMRQHVDDSGLEGTLCGPFVFRRGWTTERFSTSAFEYTFLDGRPNEVW